MKLTPATSTIGIIGGNGRTGEQFSRLFREQGFTVRTTSSTTADRNKELFAECAVILFSVPLDRSVEVMEQEIVHAIRPDQLLLDVSSLKSHQVKAMLKGKGEVIGMHPLFGPTTDPANETIILCPARCEGETLESLHGVLKAMGLRIAVKTPEEHDKLMTFIQALPHLKSLLMADALQRLGADIPTITSLCTPAYEIELNVIGRFLDDHPDLYGPIIFENPQTTVLLDTLAAIISDYQSIAKRKDQSAFAKRYEELKKFFGDFTRQARAHSEACIRTLSSLTKP